MSRSVTYNGMTSFRAGGLTRVNAGALAQIGLASNGIIGLIGEADGGVAEPGVIVEIDDPALAAEQFKSGVLADAIGTSFDPSVDPRMPGGAFRVLAIRVNSSTQSAKTLYGRVLTGTSTAASTNLIITVTGGGLIASAHVGNILRFNGEERTITDNDATTITVSPAFTVAPVLNDAIEVLAPMVVLTSKKYGVEANQVKAEWEPGAVDGGAWTSTFGGISQTSEDIGDKSFLELEYVGQSALVVHHAATAASAGAGSTTTLEDTAAGLVVNAHTDHYVFADTSDNLTVNNLRHIASNTAVELTVTLPFLSSIDVAENPWAAGGTVYSIRTGRILTMGPAATNDSGVTASWATDGTTVTLNSDISIALNELASMTLAIVSGTGAGQRRQIASNTSGVSSVITLATADAFSTVPDATSNFEIRYNRTATGTFTGAGGLTTGFTTSVAKNGALAATDLTASITSKTTIQELVFEINANADYVAAVPSGVNPSILVSSFDYDLGATGVDIVSDKALVTSQPTPTLSTPTTWPNNFKRNLAMLVDDINDKAEFYTAARSAGVGSLAGGGRPEWSGTGAVGIVGDSEVLLTGGTRGTSNNTAWQNAFDLLLTERHNYAIPLIVRDLSLDGLSSTADWASVSAQLSAHVDSANGISKNECGGLIGFKGTKAQTIAAANVINNADVQLCAQTLKVLDSSSTLVVQDEWALACVAAGMRAGAPEVAEPLTHKFIKTFALSQDSSWDPKERTDANQMIQNGILFAEFKKGKGFRFVRDLTTYVQDDNLAFSEGSTRDAVRFIAYGLRTTLEDKYTGVKAKPANAGSIKDSAGAYLEAANADNVIVSSLNENGEFVPGFEKLRVTVSGDIAKIKVQIYPAVGINFQLSDIFLQLPVLAA